MVPVNGQADFMKDANLTGLNLMSLAINAGYMYSFVYQEKWFLTLSVIPGIHYNVGDFASGSLHQIPGNINVKLNSMNSIGYNGRKFYAGIYYLYNGQLNRIRENLYAEIGYGKLAAFVGYRFALRKSPESEKK